MRPGRLDRILYVGPPDQTGREEILRIKTRNMSVEDTINLAELAALVSSGSLVISFPTNNCVFLPPLSPLAIPRGRSVRGAQEQRSPQCVRRLLSLKCRKILTLPSYVGRLRSLIFAVPSFLFHKVSQQSFVAAAKSMKRQITPTVLEKYARWRNDSGIRSL